MAVAPQRTAQGSPSVLVEPGSHASAGQAAVLRVHARNISGRPQDFSVSAVGLEGSWLPAAVTVPGVPADATATFEMTLTPPVGAAPGDYPFVVTVEARTTPGSPAATTLADGALRVDGVSDLVLTVEPADSQALRRRKVHVVLANTGDQPVRVRLDAGSDPELSVDLGDGDLDVGPHQTVRIPGAVRARRPRIVGHARRTSFHVTATGARAPQRFDGTVSLRAVFAPALLRVVAIAMVAVLWIGAVLAVLPWVSAQFGSGRNDKTSSSSTPSPNESAGASAGPGTGTGGGAAGTPGAPGTPGAATPGVRVAGLVTGSAPAGVVVSVQPASALSTTPTTASAPSSTPPPTASGLEKAVTALLDPSRALAAAVVDKVHAKAEPSDSSAVGKVLATSLPVERTDQISQRRSTVTDDGGSWAFADLSPTARYLIVLAKPGFQTQRFLVTGAQAAAASMKVVMVPGKGTMSGLISGPSGPIGGVEVTLSDGTTTVTTRSATTGHVGFWEVDGLSTPSTYLVSASGDKLGAQSALVSLAPAATRTVNLSLNAGVATLSGTVRGIDSLGGFGGLGGLTVTATSGDTTRTATTVTGDRAGTFVLPDLPVPASYTVSVSGDGYATQTRQIDLTSAGISPIDITMTSTGGTVQGTVTEPDGTGLAGAGLVLDGPSGTYKTMSSSDSGGTFRFSGIAPGQYVLTAVMFSHSPASTQVTVTSGGNATADLVLQPVPGGGLTATSFIQGGVRDATTGGQITCPYLLAGEKCAVTVSASVPDASGVKTTVSITNPTPDIDYHFPDSKLTSGLLPGFYRLKIEAPGYEPGFVNVVVPMGQTVDATTVALEQSPSVIGTIQARVGTVPDTTCVIAVSVDATNPTAPCVKTGATPADGCSIVGAACSFLSTNGSYAINRLHAGSFRIIVVPAAGSEYLAPDVVTVALVPGASRRFDAILDRYGVLSVTVMRSDGTSQVLPENSATVSIASATATGPMPAPVTTNMSGFAQLRGIPQASDYTVTATSAGDTASLTNLSVGLNQEVTVQLVIASAAKDNVTGQVVYQQAAGLSKEVPNASVQITGTTGFNGLIPIRTTSTPAATTDTLGGFTFCVVVAGCPGPPTSTNLALIGDRVDVHVTAPGYVPFTATDVATSALNPITLTPRGVSFQGLVGFDPTPDPADLAGTLAKVQFEVRSAPPGVGNLSLTTAMGPSGPIAVWSDSAQPTDPAGGRLILPGKYVVAASLAGYDTDVVPFEVTPNQAMSPITFTLHKFGFLRVSVAAAQDHTVGVQGSIMTLSLPGGVTQRIVADPGNDYVDFGDLPTGKYQVAVRAPGYARQTTFVNVVAGQTVLTPEVVYLVKLGALTGVVKTHLAVDWDQVQPDAQVTASGPQPPDFSATTGADGRYRITGTTTDDGLVSGAWTVTATAGTASNAVTTSIPTSSTVVMPVDVEAPEIILPAQRGNLLVEVVDGTKRVNGLTLQLTYTEPGGPRTVLPDCVGGDKAGTCPGTDGQYQFNGVLPLTYNLNISGGGYSPLTLPVTVGPGQNQTVQVPITTPAGSIQGLVLHQAATGGSSTVNNATITLKQGSTTVDTTTSDTNGQYKFAAVAPGAYTLSTTLSTPSGDLSAARNVTVLPGQGIVVDLVLSDVTRQVVVTVTSANNTDLSGALVALSGNPSAPAGQPVIRTGAGANTYSTTFNQVPVGTWTITVSGPSGHLGSTTLANVVVDAGTDAYQAAITVTETQLALRATSSAASPPSTVVATITQGTTTLSSNVNVFVGGGDTVLFVPAKATTVTGTTSGSYTVNVTGGTIGANAGQALVTMDVVGQSTTTTASASAPTTVSTGDVVTVTAQVTPGSGGKPNNGTLQLQRSTTPVTTWTDVGPSPTVNGNSQTLTATTDSSWGTGTVSLRVVYSGGGIWGPSTSSTFTVTVQTPTTIGGFAYAAGATGPPATPGTITAAVGPVGVTGTVTFFSGPGPGTQITGCVNVPVVSGTATCSDTLATGTTRVWANLSGTGVYADKAGTPTNIVVP
ncbi:carboxypeptidase regulatory-like domain-containing protein [Cellulomonas sp. McL0617]|uniref:carboxypeptidase regulatory-like domain-containing protein n=1 Tax=Cellulomonas sp. McL0617 TaxID=3415675 RepID=UPI003CE9F64E